MSVERRDWIASLAVSGVKSKTEGSLRAEVRARTASSRASVDEASAGGMVCRASTTCSCAISLSPASLAASAMARYSF